MGFIQNEIEKKVPNATHCLTRSAVEASHVRKGQEVVFNQRIMEKNVRGQLLNQERVIRNHVVCSL